MSKNKGKNYYIGKAGQLAVMSKLALRGYNIAIPEVDIGDDIFVVDDATGKLYRLQVKTRTAELQKKSQNYQTDFSIRIDQILDLKDPDLDYVFVTRFDDKDLLEFVIIPRREIETFMNEGFGSKDYSKDRKRPSMKYVFVFGKNERIVLGGRRNGAGGKDITEYRNNWAKWPSILDQTLDTL